MGSGAPSSGGPTGCEGSLGGAAGLLSRGFFYGCGAYLGGVGFCWGSGLEPTGGASPWGSGGPSGGVGTVGCVKGFGASCGGFFYGCGRAFPSMGEGASSSCGCAVVFNPLAPGEPGGFGAGSWGRSPTPGDHLRPPAGASRPGQSPLTGLVRPRRFVRNHPSKATPKNPSTLTPAVGTRHVGARLRATGRSGRGWKTLGRYLFAGQGRGFGQDEKASGFARHGGV